MFVAPLSSVVRGLGQASGRAGEADRVRVTPRAAGAAFGDAHCPRRGWNQNGTPWGERSRVGPPSHLGREQGHLALLHASPHAVLLMGVTVICNDSRVTSGCQHPCSCTAAQPFRAVGCCGRAFRDTVIFGHCDPAQDVQHDCKGKLLGDGVKQRGGCASFWVQAEQPAGGVGSPCLLPPFPLW